MEEETDVKNHVLDVNDILRLNRWILKPIGVWPTSDESNLGLATKKILNFVVIGMICFIVIPCVIFVILEVTDTYERLRFAGPLIFFLIAMLKYISLIFHERDIVDCVDKMKEDLGRSVSCSPEETIVISRYVDFGRRIIIVCAFFMYGGAIFFYLVVPLRAGRILDAATNDTYLPLVYPQPKISIVRTRSAPTNEIFFLLQCVSGFLVHTITVGSCSWAAVLAMHICGQFDVLKIRLKSLVDGPTVRPDDDVQKKFCEIVKRHVRILK